MARAHHGCAGSGVDGHRRRPGEARRAVQLRLRYSVFDLVSKGGDVSVNEKTGGGEHPDAGDSAQSKGTASHVRERPGEVADGNRAALQGSQLQPPRRVPAHLRHPARVHRFVPRVVERGGRGTVDGWVLLDPVPGRPRVHRVENGRHRFQVAHGFLIRGAAAWVARHHRVSDSSRAPGGVAKRVAENHAAGTTKRGPEPTTNAGDFEIPAPDDRFLFPERPRGAHSVLVREQHLKHRADGVLAENHQGA
mmetsp:Transcript_13183/g.43689  ORF Transcript_13183/g.43689 Transcript_13183/m.43689 type:complete len:250 (+) Transcript_13183:441-1190(+)